MEEIESITLKQSVENDLSKHLFVHTEKIPCESNTYDELYPANEETNIDIMNEHAGKNVDSLFHCDVCKKVFRRKDNLNKHKKIHMDRRMLYCEHCNKLFLDEGRLKKHVLVVHLGHKKNYHCTDCGNSYVAKRSLRIHMYKHLQKKPAEKDPLVARFDLNNLSKQLKQEPEESGYDIADTFINDKVEVDSLDERDFCVKYEPLAQPQKNGKLPVPGDRVWQTEFVPVLEDRSSFDNMSEQLKQEPDKTHSIIKDTDVKVEVDSNDEMDSYDKRDDKLRDQNKFEETELGTKVLKCLEANQGQNTFSCTICEEAFNMKCDLDNHLIIHAAGKNFHCTVCRKSFFRKSTWKRHSYSHAGPSSFLCETCNTNFTQKSSLHAHISRSHPEKLFKCDMCTKSFIKAVDFDIHRSIHSGERPFVCKICSMSFVNNGSLQLHVASHSAEKNFKCKFCPRAFQRKNRLEYHIFKKHSEGSTLQCDNCNKKFASRWNLVKHIETHSVRKPYHCEICNKPFSQKRSIQSHMRLHTEKDKFNCKVCGKSYTTNGSLKTHILLTHEDDSYS